MHVGAGAGTKNTARAGAGIKHTAPAGIRACLLSLLILAACLLGGCHGKIATSSFAVPGSFDTEKKYTITFWAKNDTNKTQVKIYNKAVEGFEALYPNIDVQIRLYTNYGDIYNDVITNISTGTTPNVCITYPDNIATYMGLAGASLHLSRRLWRK